MHFDVLEAGKGVHVPELVAALVLAERVLHHVDHKVLFGGLALWNEDDLAEATDDVPVVRQTHGLVVVVLLVKLKGLVLVGDHNRAVGIYLREVE